MNPAWLLVMLTTVPGQSPVAKDDPAPAGRPGKARTAPGNLHGRRGGIHDLPRRQSQGKGRVAARAGLRLDEPGAGRRAGRRGLCVDLPGARRGSRLLLFVPREGAAKPVPRVSFALALGARRRARRRTCIDLDAPGSGHRDRTDSGRACSRPIRPAAALADAHAHPRFLRLDQGPPGEALGAAPAASAPLSL